MTKRRIFAAALGAWGAMGIAGGALAAPPVMTDSAVFIEQVRPGNVRQLAPADRLQRGDRVVTVVTWRRASPSGGFVITNPLPGPIAYQASGNDDEQVSVDGGRNWGRIGLLKVGTRLATPEDVTHVRWRVSAQTAARGRGQIAYSGIVR